MNAGGQGPAAAASGAGGGLQGGAGSAEAAAREQQRRAEAEEQRRVVLKSILTPEASERLANVRVVKPQRAQQVEMTILQMYQQGRLGGRVTEEALKQLLDQYNQGDRPTKVTIQRRKGLDSDDDENADDGW
uniref:Programmed cell death protein 5 n=1 Tax=Erythrolobus australicus TaxID=1077150 RepID=A0A7S1TMJ6_9RHOD|mmetsp:Transcript_407/g.1072  ORF Transcript_407/g.1072 Transcript_407/m.1072 type:complete len:132 (+) Transcript_407:28-423(+)